MFGGSDSGACPAVRLTGAQSKIGFLDILFRGVLRRPGIEPLQMQVAAFIREKIYMDKWNNMYR